jgi:pimeloyl-ACP methyl ester carboxylesterase
VKPRRPDAEGWLDRDGVSIHWEVHGTGSTTVLLLPTWSIVPSGHWKFQVPFLARDHRVVTFDGRGSGRSDRPAGPEHYTIDTFAADALAVLDATDTPQAVLGALSCGTLWAIELAARQPERVLGMFTIGPAVDLAPGHPERDEHPFEGVLDTTDGWAKYNAEHWLRDYRDFAEFFGSKMFTEPHSTKAWDDFVEWALEIGPERLIDTDHGISQYTTERLLAAIAELRCPVCVIHGSDDAIRAAAEGTALADAAAAELVIFTGSGHAPHLRDPIAANRVIGEFVRDVTPLPVERRGRRRTWVRASQRPKRALYLCSPIGLGHARRDVAVACELRLHHPELQIDWLAQHPVTGMLARHGERVHPASASLANESAHIEEEAGEHDLHAFQAIREMDEILVNNFSVFRDVVDQELYDLVIGDEAWDVDYFLHENPELKHFEFAWMTDFVGWLPMPSGGGREADVAADYNAEMIEQRARYRRLRDASIFVGDPDDIVPDTFGPGLPPIREWTEDNFEFAGYITGFDPAEVADREALRAALGYHPDERVCVVTVGGSGVGGDLLRRVAAGVPRIRRQVDDVRIEVVCGPRIDPASLPACEGVTYHRFVPDLYRHLAACDLAVVHGGLTTCMELVANRVPFVYVPLRNHFEQNFHVHHRLQRYRAGRRMDYDEAADPEGLAKVVADEIGREVDYLPVATDGAARAAASLAQLL